MQILSNLFEIKLSKSTIATIGTFDGIHIGHQKILNSLSRFAKENSLKSVVITFDPHPRKVINKKNSIELINTIEEKKEKIKTLGIDYLIVQKFDEKFSETEANKFVEILKNNINIKKLIVGYDHRFGKNRNADINDLKNIDEDFYILYPSIGESLDFLIKLNLKNFKFLYRSLDSFSWQFCNKGFFNFKNHIPKIVSKFT